MNKRLPFVEKLPLGKKLCANCPRLKKFSNNFFQVQQNVFKLKRIMPKFVVKDMETLFIDEVRQSINLLISNLESVPVAPRGQSHGIGGRKGKEGKSRSRWVIRCIPSSSLLWWSDNAYSLINYCSNIFDWEELIAVFSTSSSSSIVLFYF